MSNKIDKYNCPICQCILEEPCLITKCFHALCMNCIKDYIKSKLKNNKNLKVFECPLCRQKFGKDDYVLAYDLQVEIENCKITCKCGMQIPIRLYEDHQEICSSKIKRDDGTIIGNYNCTLCSKKKMNRIEYIKHIEEKHSNDEGVCAICSIQPWGDPNYKTYLLGHVNLRHSKSDVSKKDENKEELEMIKKAMEISLKEKKYLNIYYFNYY